MNQAMKPVRKSGRAVVSMNVLWVIGNGFDLNLGLDTGYKVFRERVYEKSAEAEANRNRLDSIAKKLNEKDDSDHWSDLEELLGASSEGYDAKEVELFHATFQEIQRLFVEYVKSENRRFSKSSIGQSDGNEFWDSVTNFRGRLSQVDQQQLFPITGRKERLCYRFLNLNYTSCFDDYIAWSKTKHAPFASRRIDGGVYQDEARDILHIHGSLAGDGEIVFGVGDARQISNNLFAEDDEFLALWTKSGKNQFYGNLKSSEMKGYIAGTRLFCLYGVSLGKTDCYIWREIGQVLLEEPIAQAVIFVHNLPDKRDDARKYQLVCAEKRRAFTLACGLSEEEARIVESRIMLVPSDMVFREKPTLAKNSEYPEVDEGPTEGDEEPS